MRKIKAHTQSENIDLLLEIFHLKRKLLELKIQKGPANSDYISLSIKLDLLVKKYIDEKLLKLIGTSTNEHQETLHLKEADAAKRKENHWIWPKAAPYQTFITYRRKR